MVRNGPGWFFVLSTLPSNQAKFKGICWPRRASHPDLCQNPTAWSLQTAPPRPSCCRCWWKPCQRSVSRWRKALCWCRAWKPPKPGRTPCRWPSAAPRPPRFRETTEKKQKQPRVNCFVGQLRGEPQTVANLPAPELWNDHDGAEGFLPSDEHVVPYVGEHRGLEEKPCRHNKARQRCSMEEVAAGEAAVPARCTCFPPHTNVAPSVTPVWQYSTSLSRWALWFWGPWSVERSSGSPVFIFFTSSTWRRKKISKGLKRPSKESNTRFHFHLSRLRDSLPEPSWVSIHHPKENQKKTTNSNARMDAGIPGGMSSSMQGSSFPQLHRMTPQDKHVPLFSQTDRGRFLPQTAFRLRCSSLLCWRTPSSFPETHTHTRIDSPPLLRSR